jgi:hypothetical protein
MCTAEDEELSDRQAVPSRNMASNSAFVIVSQSGASHRGRQVTGGPGVVPMWWMVVWCTLRWTPAGRVRSGNLVSRLSTGVPSLMVFTLGISALAAEAGADSNMTLSRMRLF